MKLHGDEGNTGAEAESFKLCVMGMKKPRLSGAEQRSVLN
jgi:hypothetical protein